MKKNIPKIREREGNERIHSHNSGTGIKGFHSWEWTRTGIPAHPWPLSDIFLFDQASQLVWEALDQIDIAFPLFFSSKLIFLRWLNQVFLQNKPQITFAYCTMHIWLQSFHSGEPSHSHFGKPWSAWMSKLCVQGEDWSPGRLPRPLCRGSRCCRTSERRLAPLIRISISNDRFSSIRDIKSITNHYVSINRQQQNQSEHLRKVDPTTKQHFLLPPSCFRSALDVEVVAQDGLEGRTAGGVTLTIIFMVVLSVWNLKKRPGGVPEQHFSILLASVLELLLLSEKSILQFLVLDVIHIKTKLEKVFIFRTYAIPMTKSAINFAQSPFFQWE